MLTSVFHTYLILYLTGYRLQIQGRRNQLSPDQPYSKQQTITVSNFTLTFPTFSTKYDVKKAANENLSNNLSQINHVDLRLHFGRNEKYHQVALLLKNLEKTYKSSDYSATFTASRVAQVAKEPDNAKELACGVFLRQN